MNILFLADIVPFPPNTGIKIRTYNILRELHNGGENRVYLLCFNHRILIPTAQELERCREALQQFCEEVHIFDIPSDASRLSYYGCLIRNLFQSVPYRVARYDSAECSARIRDLMQRANIDLVHMDKTEFYSYAPLLPGKPIVCTNHNVESLLMKRRAQYEKTLARRFFAYLQYRRTERFERRALSATSAYVTCTALDRDHFQKQMGIATRSAVLDNGVDLKSYPRSEVVGSDYVLIIGAQSREATANFDATWFFIESIWPLLLEKCPTIRLKIVGRDPDVSVRALPQKYGNIDVVGFVPDERELLGGAAALLVPLRVGGGSRLKILTAMGMGRVVVSTSIGAEGIDCTDGVDVFIADDPVVFADRVAKVFTDAECQRTVGSAARALMERLYDWSTIGARARKFYSEVVRERN